MPNLTMTATANTNPDDARVREQGGRVPQQDAGDILQQGGTRRQVPCAAHQGMGERPAETSELGA